MVSGVDESSVTGPPADVALTLAVRKADAVAGGLADALVLGCDSVLDLDGEALGKPADAAEAVARWRRMRGRSGVLNTGHCLIDTTTGRDAAEIASTVGALRRPERRRDRRRTSPPASRCGWPAPSRSTGWAGPSSTRDRRRPHNVVGLSLPLLRRLMTLIGDLETNTGTSVVEKISTPRLPAHCRAPTRRSPPDLRIDEPCQVADEPCVTGTGGATRSAGHTAPTAVRARRRAWTGG